MKLFKNICTVLICIIVLSSCEKNDWSKEVPLNIEVESDADESFKMYGSDFVCEDANLTITSIVFYGERLQADNVEYTYSEKIELDLISNSELKHQIKLPIGTYEKLTAKIYFDNNMTNPFIEGEVSHAGQGQGQGQGDETQELILPMTFSESDFIKIKNESEEDVILIDEESSIFEISCSIKKSFQSIQYSEWNGLITANQNQDQIELSNQAGSSFKNKVNNNFLTNIKLKITK